MYIPVKQMFQHFVNITIALLFSRVFKHFKDTLLVLLCNIHVSMRLIICVIFSCYFILSCRELRAAFPLYIACTVLSNRVSFFFASIFFVSDALCKLYFIDTEMGYGLYFVDTGIGYGISSLLHVVMNKNKMSIENCLIARWVFPRDFTDSNLLVNIIM